MSKYNIDADIIPMVKKAEASKDSWVAIVHNRATSRVRGVWQETSDDIYKPEDKDEYVIFATRFERDESIEAIERRLDDIIAWARFLRERDEAQA